MMNTLAFEMIGWLIVHSLWQFALIAALAWGTVDLLLRRATASLRYAALAISLLGLLACPLVTAFWLWPPPAAPQTVVYELPPMTATPQPGGSPTSPQVAEGATELPPELPTNSPTSPLASPIVFAEFSWFETITTTVRPWLTWIALAWSGGVCLVGLRLIFAWRQIEHLKRTGRTIDDLTFQSRLQAAIRKLQIRQSIQVLASDWIESPVVVGMLRSVILVPTSFVSGVSPDHLEAILAHELAHVRRYDYLANVAQMILEALFFYHPCAWWISHRLRLERENCCDDLAAAVMSSPAAYSRALVALEELRGSAISPALGARGGSLSSRIRRLIASPVRRDSLASGRLAVAMIVCTVAGLLWIGAPSLQAEDAPPKPIDENEFTVKLDSGLAIELLAIQPHDQTTEQAWKPDGSPYVPPADSAPLTSSFSQDAPGSVDLFFRYHGQFGEISPIYQIDKLQGWDDPNGAGDASLLATPHADAKSGDIAVGIPDRQFGPWCKLNVEGKLQELLILKPRFQQAYQTIRPHEIRPLANRVMFCWAQTQAEEDLANRELVAVDKTGKRHQRWAGTAWKDEDGGVHNADVFDLSVDQIARFEYRLRPIRDWVTFKNIALKPGERTEVAIERRPVEIPQSTDSRATYRGRIVLEDGSAATAKGWLYCDIRHSHGTYVGNGGQAQDSFEVRKPAGAVFFSYFPDDYAPAWTPRFNVEPGDVVDGLTLKLKPGFDLSTSVVNEAGAPVPSAVVVMHPVIHGSVNGPVFEHVADQSGQLTLAHMASSPYHFRINAPGYEELRLQSQKVAPGQPLTLTMRKAAATTGTVQTADGEPAIGAKLHIVLEILPDGSTNFLYDAQGNTSLGKTFATTDQEGRFSLDRLSRDRRYLFLIEGVDQSRMIYRDLRAGQRDLEINLPDRRDLQLELHGDLSEYYPAGASPTVQIAQRFLIETDNGNATATIGVEAPLKRNESGGTVVGRGLIVDPQANEQFADLSNGHGESIVEKVRLAADPVTSQTLQLGPTTDQ